MHQNSPLPSGLEHVWLLASKVRVPGSSGVTPVAGHHLWHTGSSEGILREHTVPDPHITRLADGCHREEVGLLPPCPPLPAFFGLKSFEP